MSTTPEALKKRQWTIQAFDLASKPGEFVEKPAVTGKDALDLVPKSAKALAPEISIAELAKLQKEAKAILDTLTKLAVADPDAEGSEWKGVADACAAVRSTLEKRELRTADLDTAKKQLALILPAQQKARDAIQARLRLAAQGLRDAAAKARTPDADVKGAEWAGVVNACNAVDAALPKGALKKSDVAKAKLEADKIAGVVAQARSAIQDRLKLEAQGVRDKLAPLAALDPEARGDEWNAVTAAAKVVEAALPSGTLSNAHIATATQKLMGVSLAATDAHKKIQTRLALELKGIRDAIPPFRIADPEARGAEWARVTAACDKADGALPTGTLTAAALVPAQTLQKRLPVVVKTVKLSIQRRLGAEADVLRAALAPYKAAEKGGEGLWGPVTEACRKVEAALPKADLKAADLTEAKRLLDLIPPLVGPVYEALWKLDTAAAQKTVADEIGKGKPSDPSFQGLMQFIQADAAVKLYVAQTKAALAPADTLGYRRMKAELERLTGDACAQIKALKKALETAGLGATADAAVVKETLAACNHRHLAEHAQEAVQKRAQAELAALLAAKADAEKKHAFRISVPSADETLAKAAAEIDRLHEALARDVSKDWKRNRFTDKLAVKNGPFSAEDLAHAQADIGGWNKSLDKYLAERLKQEKIVSDTVATYGNATPALPLDVLEVVIEAVGKHLLSTTAIGLYNKFTQSGGKVVPLAVWKRAMAEALDKQIAAPTKGTEWAKRFGLGYDSGESWGVDKTGLVDGVQTHLTLYPNKVESSVAGTDSQIVDNIIGKDVTGIHVTQEWNGKDNPNNPKVFRGTTRNLPKTMKATQDAMYLILNRYIADFKPIAKEWKDRAGLASEQVAANKLYIAELEGKIDKMV